MICFLRTPFLLLERNKSQLQKTASIIIIIITVVTALKESGCRIIYGHVTGIWLELALHAVFCTCNSGW